MCCTSRRMLSRMFHGSKPSASRITPTRIDSKARRKMTASGGPPKNRVTRSCGGAGFGDWAGMLMRPILSLRAGAPSNRLRFILWWSKRPATPGLDLREHALECLQPIGFARRLVPAQAVDPREAHGKARSMTARALQPFEGYFQDQAGVGLVRNLAHRAKTINGVAPDVAIDRDQLLIREAEIGLADRHQNVARIGSGPDPERVVGIIGGALAVPALRVHQHAIDDERVALPFP